MEGSPRGETEPLPILPVSRTVDQGDQTEGTDTTRKTTDITSPAVSNASVPSLQPLVQLRRCDIPTYRATILQEQNNMCCICKDPVSEESGVSLDHQHRTQTEIVGLNGAGLVRGVLCRNCNVFEGKIWNNSKRYGHHHRLPQILRQMADYLERENYPYIHPNEAPRPRCVSKRQYNKMAKRYALESTSKRACPLFSGKRKPSKRLLDAFEHYGISPYVNPAALEMN